MAVAQSAVTPLQIPTDAVPERVVGREPIQLSVRRAAQAGKLDVLGVGVFADGTLPRAAQPLLGTRLTSIAQRAGLKPKVGETLLVWDESGKAAQRILLVSLGPREELGDQTFIRAMTAAAKALAATNAREIVVAALDFDWTQRTLPWRLQNASRLVADGFYKFAAPKRNEGEAAQPQVAFLIEDELSGELELAVRTGRAMAEGMALAKDLGNLPGNICHPGYLADVARALGRAFALSVEVLEREEMAQLGMNSALSVGRASDQPCRLIVMKYMGGAQNDKPIVLIGKGVTFDTGGVSLKPGEDLDMMKYDMCGAASVFGALKTVARLALPLNVVGIVGAVENMPGGNASRPGDVVRSMSELTIEILNTDAEGRLVLCDALTYAQRFDPSCVIDIATLTGACVIALGSQTSGLFANDDAIADELLRCGTETGDRAWRMPLFEEYQKQLESNFADMSNLGGKPAGAVTAACFLGRFAEQYTWAHLDIAGTASTGGEAKGATGRPVPLISEFLLQRTQHASA